MSVDKTYRCDLCSTMKDPGQLVGIYWVGLDAIEIRAAREVEHHLCHKCIESIAKIALEVKP